MHACKTQGLAGGAELPGMLATFSSYEELFGPSHPLTLRLLTEVGITLWRHGRTRDALTTVQRGQRDTARVLGRNHALRLGLLAALRDLCIELHDYENAASAQRELLECHAERFGAEHAETLAAREILERIL